MHTKTKLHSHKRYVGENIRMQEVTCFKDSDSNDFWVLEEIDSIYIWKQYNIINNLKFIINLINAFTYWYIMYSN